MGPPARYRVMRKLIVCNIISLDGFFSGPGGDVMAMPFDNGFSDYNAERLRAADTLLLGRTRTRVSDPTGPRSPRTSVSRL